MLASCPHETEAYSEACRPAVVRVGALDPGTGNVVLIIEPPSTD